MMGVVKKKGGVDIAFFLQSLSRKNPGGVVKNTLRLSGEFSRRSLKVDVVVASDQGGDLAEPESGVRVVNLGAKKPKGSLFRLARYLREEAPKGLISARPLANCTAVIANKLARVGAHVIVTERTQLLEEAKAVNEIGYRLMPTLVRWIYPAAGSIVSVSSGVGDSLAEMVGINRERIRVIYNPVVGRGMLKTMDEPCHHPWFQPGQPPVILGCGRLSEEKGFDLLLRAFSKVRDNFDARLVILGEGELRSSLGRMSLDLGIADCISFPGHVANPYPFIRRSGVFVLSSLYEGFGNVLVEAMACGVPVVSTDCPSGPSEILECGKWGRLVPVGDVNAMSEAILNTLQSQLHPDVASRAGYFSVERAADAYLDLIK